MTYKDKLIDLLKSDDEVKTVMEKLEFGCKLKLHFKNGNSGEYTIAENGEYVKGIVQHNNNYRGFERISLDSYEIENFEIIGIPLQERFIQIYLEKYKRVSYFNTNGIVQIHNEIENTFYDFELDNRKDFDNQDDTIYQKIYEALYNLTK